MFVGEFVDFEKNKKNIFFFEKTYEGKLEKDIFSGHI